MKVEPGIYPGVSYNEYASWEAVNHSKLVGFNNTPAHARHMFLFEAPPTPAKEFGWLAHLAVLEPERLWHEACVRPDVDGRTKEGKPVLDAFKETLKQGGANEGKKVLTSEQQTKLVTMTKNAREHETAREYLTGPGHNELSIVWMDKETGRLCKARIDRISVVSKLPGAPPEAQPSRDRFMLVMDFKTHGDPATLRSFERSILNFNYASQAAMYLEGLNVLMPADELRPYVWIVAETDAPHLVRLFTPTPDLLEWGHQRWHGWMRQYAECEKSGSWPGWDPGIEEANLPAWAGKVWELGL